MEMRESLELVVKNESLGVLETNISDIENFVCTRIKDYAPENYMGDADEAKKDRAELNKAKKQLAETRKRIIERLMKPYIDFENRCKNLEKLIDKASCALDEIVKTKENEEKQAKRMLIETEWQKHNFDLFSLDKVFNPKWLNKTYKITDISNEITIIIDRTYKDLQTIEKYSDNAQMLKAHYLMCLNIGDTLDYGEELKKKKELARKEAEEREKREHEAKINEQKKELALEVLEHSRKTAMENLVAQAAADNNESVEIPKVEVEEYVFTVKVTEGQLLGLKNFLTGQSITYECEKIVF